jgi:hypothetical protein
MTPDVEIYIEELVLRGFAPGDRASIGEAVQRELTRLIGEQGLASMNRDIEIARVNGGAFDVKPGARSETIGAQIAQSVYQGLNPTHGR